MVVVGELDGLGIVISCDGWEGLVCCNRHVSGRASCFLRMVRHLESSCLANCW